MTACAPHSSMLIALGVFTFVVETVLLLTTLRPSRAGKRWTTSEPLTIALALGGALLVPCVLAALLTRGRQDLIAQLTGSWTPRFEPMTHPLNQTCFLRLGILLSLPSLAISGVTMGAVAAARFQDRAVRIPLCAAVPLVLTPLFLGAFVFLQKLQAVFELDSSWSALTYNRSRSRAAIEAILADARRDLDLGAHLALTVLCLGMVWLAYRALRNRENAHAHPRRRLVVSVAMLTAAAMVTWFTGPMTQENRSPFPSHALRWYRRVAPPPPPSASQSQLYALSDGMTMGFYRSPLSFPLVHQEMEDEPPANGPRIQIAAGHLLFDGKRIWDGLGELAACIQEWRDNFPLLHPNEEPGTPLIEASATTSMQQLSGVLELVHHLGWREVRLVTGVPQTIERPVIGSISRAVLQATTVALSRSSDSEPQTSRTDIRIPDGLRSYGVLVDQVLAARRMSRPCALILDSQDSNRPGRFE